MKLWNFEIYRLNQKDPKWSYNRVEDKIKDQIMK